MVRGKLTLDANDGDPPNGEDDEKLTQTVQVALLAGETRDQIQRVQQYGFTSVPLEGAYPVLVLCPSGERAQAIAVAVDDLRHRVRGGAPGDVSVYDHRGNRITMKDGVLEIVSAGNLTVTVTGDVTVSATGQVHLGGAGGAAVARVGDAVALGVIVSGSPKVKAQ